VLKWCSCGGVHVPCFQINQFDRVRLVTLTPLALVGAAVTVSLLSRLVLSVGKRREDFQNLMFKIVLIVLFLSYPVTSQEIVKSLR
jgi:hypothetical protein